MKGTENVVIVFTFYQNFTESQSALTVKYVHTYKEFDSRVLLLLVYEDGQQSWKKGHKHLTSMYRYKYNTVRMYSYWLWMRQSQWVKYQVSPPTAGGSSASVHLECQNCRSQPQRLHQAATACYIKTQTETRLVRLVRTKLRLATQ